MVLSKKKANEYVRLIGKNATDQSELHKQAYELWFKVMVRSDSRQWSEDMHIFFDDVKTQVFSDWWEWWRPTLELPHHSGIEILKTTQDFEDYNDNYGLVVWLDLFKSKRDLLHAVSVAIEEAMPRKASDLPSKSVGAPKFKDSLEALAPDLPLASAITQARLDALRKVLSVYDACKAADMQKAKGEKHESRYQIGERLGILDQEIVSPGDLDATDKTNVMRAAIARYYKWGRELIVNAEKGIFPKHSSSKKRNQTLTK